MTTYNTGNPVPSTAVKDLYDNSQTEDEFVNLEAPLTITRIGKSIKTMYGYTQDFNNFLINSGFEPAHLVYTDGTPLVVSRPTQLIDRAGITYRIKMPSTFPVTLTGNFATDAAKLIDVGDLSLRLDLASTATGKGDALIGVKQPTANSVALTLDKLIQQTVLFAEYGGVDDFNGTTGTNCFAALNAIIADFAGPTTVIFPKSIGGTGRYLFNGSVGNADMSRFTFQLDDGVSFHVIGANTPLLAKGLKVNRPLDIRMATANYTRRISSFSYGQVAGKPIHMSAADGEAPIIERVITSTALEMNYQSISFADGSKSVASASADGAVASLAIPVSANYLVASAPIRPGQEIHSCVTTPGLTAGQARIAMYVETEGGFIILAQDSASGGAMIRYVFLEGFAIGQTAIGDPFADAPAYKFNVSELGIKVHGPRSFSFLINHVEVFRMDPANLTSDILRAGWGVGAATVAHTAYISQPYRVRAKKNYGVRPLRVFVLGDSTADYNNSFSWVNHFERSLAGVGGIQIKTLTNLAVAGQTTLQQRDIFNATDVSALGGGDICLIATGINDQGGAVPVANFLQACVDIATRCATFNMVPIFAIHSMYYDQASAAPYGQTGQNAALADRGADYRTQLARKLAELNLPGSFFTIEDMGAILPSMLTNPRLNPVVDDNVHFSNFGSELVGMAWAKAVIGFYFQALRKDITFRNIKVSWIPTAQQATYGNVSRCAFGIRGDTFFMGNDHNVPASPPFGTVLFKLPHCYAPANQLFLTLPGSVAGTVGSLIYTLQVQVRVDPDGTVYTQTAVPNLVYINFSGVQWALKS